VLIHLWRWLFALLLALAVAWSALPQGRTTRDAKPVSAAGAAKRAAKSAKAAKAFKRLAGVDRGRARAALHAHRDAAGATWDLDDDDDEITQDDISFVLDDDDASSADVAPITAAPQPFHSRAPLDWLEDTQPRCPILRVPVPPPKHA
jgi:hypothetical protein